METEKIRKLVEEYKKAISTQNKKDFCKLWSRTLETSLISVADIYNGTDEIYNDFLIGKIQKAYISIELFTESLEIRFLKDNMAIVIFKYHTECIKRENKEPYGIFGVETQLVIKENADWKLLHIHYSKK